MSVNGINGSNFDFSLLQGVKAGQLAGTNDKGADFLSSLKMRIADFTSQTVGTLISSGMNTDIAKGASSLAALLGSDNASGNSLAALLGNVGGANGLSATGRNTALFDPESAYRMMSTINTKDVTYKAEFSEMSDMKSYLSTMQQEALKLGVIDGTTGNEAIKGSVQAFADAYNGWIDRFDEGLQKGGLLAGTQAATVSQWELEQSVENIFNGAKNGLHGMRDLGFSIDPVTNFASVNGAQLDSILASNKTGAVGTLQEFSANFAKAAELLNSADNFIPKRLDNLARVIDYIDDNKQSLQAEFGQGDAAKPTGEVARALASYKAMHGLVA